MAMCNFSRDLNRSNTKKKKHCHYRSTITMFFFLHIRTIEIEYLVSCWLLHANTDTRNTSVHDANNPRWEHDKDVFFDGNMTVTD